VLNHINTILESRFLAGRKKTREVDSSASSIGFLSFVPRMRGGNRTFNEIEEGKEAECNGCLVHCRVYVFSQRTIYENERKGNRLQRAAQLLRDY
jgi:hypothetical protein